MPVLVRADTRVIWLALPCLGKTSAILESGISSTVMPLFCFENNTAHASQRCATHAVTFSLP